MLFLSIYFDEPNHEIVKQIFSLTDHLGAFGLSIKTDNSI